MIKAKAQQPNQQHALTRKNANTTKECYVFFSECHAIYTKMIFLNYLFNFLLFMKKKKLLKQQQYI